MASFNKLSMIDNDYLQTKGHLVVGIFPEVQCNQLEGVEHGPAKVVKVGIPKSWIITQVWQTGKTIRTFPVSVVIIILMMMITYYNVYIS